MTRDDALLKLLAIEPERDAVLAQVTGWPLGETEATLQRLHQAGLVAYRFRGNNKQRVWFTKPSSPRSTADAAARPPGAQPHRAASVFHLGAQA